MKKPLIIGSIFIVSLLSLFVFNKITSNRDRAELFAEAANGRFEISVTTAGELIAENSIDILGPEIVRGRDIRVNRIEIQDLVPEGSLVKKGDYVANLNRTELSNSLKDARERLIEMQRNLEMRLLDSAIQLNGLRDQIRNQEFNIVEREMTFMNSKFEPPTVVRQAEINLEQAKRVLDQTMRNYSRRYAQVNRNINNQKLWISRMDKRVNDLEEVLAGFTVIAPADGMVIYKREWRGNKRKAGSFIEPRDRVIATLPDLSSMISKIYVGEIDVNKIKKGLEVDINVDAFPAKAFKGHVSFIANIGEKLPNSNDKMFEVLIKLDNFDPDLRPSMTTGNKVLIKAMNDVIYIPTECIQAGNDGIPFVYKKNGTKQIVVTGEVNDKHMVIEAGLEPGTKVYLGNPENPEKFRLVGQDLIPLIKGLENNEFTSQLGDINNKNDKPAI
jgi:hypothetical protein